jgi:hypothetical protein
MVNYTDIEISLEYAIDQLEIDLSTDQIKSISRILETSLDICCGSESKNLIMDESSKNKNKIKELEEKIEKLKNGIQCEIHACFNLPKFKGVQVKDDGTFEIYNK